MPTVEVWVALGEDGTYEVATDKDTVVGRLIDASGDDVAGAVCRVVKLNVVMSEPREDDDGKTDEEVDVTVPDKAGHIVEVGSE